MRCPQCRLENPPSALACDCGYGFTAASESQAMAHGSTTASTSAGQRAMGTIGGLWFGGGCGVMLVVLGIAFIAGGTLGIPIGVGLLIAGIALPIYLAYAWGGALRGPCPYCGSQLFAEAGQPGVTCQACRKRVVVREKHFFRVE